MFCRIIAVHANGAEEEQEVNVSFDVLLAENNTIAGQFPVFGLWGGFGAGDDFYPLVLKPNGEIDLGSEWEENRFGKSNLRERKICVGEYFSFDCYGETYTYKISRILSSKELVG